MAVLVDRVGKQYGKLTVIQRAKSRPRASGCSVRTFWLCRCNCGSELEVDASSLSTRNTISCGKCSGKNEAGKRYGRLLVVKRVAKDPLDRYPRPPFRTRQQGVQWLCRCDCGKEITTRGSNLRRGESRSCGCVGAKKLRAAVILPFGQAAKNQALRSIKDSAAIREYSFELSDEETLILMSRSCHYCGGAPSNRSSHPEFNGDFRYNGIDRIDNALGYVHGNVVSCCKHCNIAKRDRSHADFLAWIKRVYNHSVASSRRVIA